jgi:hypothetical protein
MKQNTAKLLEEIAAINAAPPTVYRDDNIEQLRVDIHRAAKKLKRTVITRKIDPSTLHVWAM